MKVPVSTWIRASVNLAPANRVTNANQVWRPIPFASVAKRPRSSLWFIQECARKNRFLEFSTYRTTAGPIWELVDLELLEDYPVLIRCPSLVPLLLLLHHLHQVKKGKVLKSPYRIAGYPQTRRYGFYTYWRNKKDIQRMRNICVKYIKPKRKPVFRTKNVQGLYLVVVGNKVVVRSKYLNKAKEYLAKYKRGSRCLFQVRGRKVQRLQDPGLSKRKSSELRKRNLVRRRRYLVVDTLWSTALEFEEITDPWNRLWNDCPKSAAPLEAAGVSSG